MQPRAKSRVFELAYIRSHPLPVTFHLFLPQICHNEFWLLIGVRSAEAAQTGASSRAQRLNRSLEPLTVYREGGPISLENCNRATRDDKLARNHLMKEPRATLDPISEPDVEAAWSAEIERRLVEIDAGTVELILWDDVRSELFGESECKE